MYFGERVVKALIFYWGKAKSLAHSICCAETRSPSQCCVSNGTTSLD